AALTAVRIGRIVVTPPWTRDSVERTPGTIVLTIQPSMGFGTGHHPSTRLCLQLLQFETLQGASVLDVGTGSGVLAIASVALGAARVVGLDVDQDALISAAENRELNGLEDRVDLRVLDITKEAAAFSTEFDVITANLTGAMLERHAKTLTHWAN